MTQIRGLRAVLAAILIAATGSVPARAYPSGAVESFDSRAQVKLTPVPGCVDTPFTQNVLLAGPTTVRRGDPKVDETGRQYVETEMLQLDLVGVGPTGPVSVRLDRDRGTLGMFRQQDAGLDFPADSFFDVFVEITTPQGSFVNLEPIHMQSEIMSLPPRVPYLPPPGTCIPFAPRGVPVPVLWMIHAEHLPLPVVECLEAYVSLSIHDARAQRPFQNLFNSLGGSAVLVHGTPVPGSQIIPTEMVSLDLRGTATSDGVTFRPFSLSEPPRRGSFGALGATPEADSFFDVFIELELDGSSSGEPLVFRGKRQPSGELYMILQRAASLGSVTVLGGALYVRPGPVSCPEA